MQSLWKVLPLVLGVAFATEGHGKAASTTAIPVFTTLLGQENPLAGRIWLPSGQHFIQAKELLERAHAADVVLLGEAHDNPDHHALQAWVVENLMGETSKPVVAFEMIDSSQKEALRAALQAAPGDASGLEQALGWERSGWPAWSMYRPIFNAAVRAGAPILPANLSRLEVQGVAKGVPPSTLIGTMEDPKDPAVIAVMRKEIQDGHCGMLPETALPGMVRVQWVRDMVMTEALMEGVKQTGAAVLIAGAGHARTDWGVPGHLARAAPGKVVFSVAFVEIEIGEEDPRTYGERFGTKALPFDAVWFTPRVEREDQCQALRKHMEEKRAKDQPLLSPPQ